MPLLYQWQSVPPLYKFMATDENGDIYAYTQQPIYQHGHLSHGRWISLSGSSIKVAFDPNFLKNNNCVSWNSLNSRLQ